MNKADFLTELQRRIAEYPSEETKRSVEYYTEMLDDRIEEGMTEEEVVASLGSLTDIAEQIKCEIPLTTLVKHKAKEKTKSKKMSPWVILMLILGFPLWGPLLLACFYVFFSLYMLIWVFDIVLWTGTVALGAVVLNGLIGCIVNLVRLSVPSACFYLGSAMLALGLCIFWTWGTKVITKGIVYGTKRCFIQFKKSL